MAGEQLTTANAPGWSAWIPNFVKTRDAFAKSYSQLLAKRDFIYSSHPELRAEYDARVAEAQKKQADLNTLASVMKQVQDGFSVLAQFAQGAFEWSPFGLVYKGGQTIGGWIKGALGLGEVYFDEDGQLGVVQVILIGVGLTVATAMVAAIAYFVTDNNKYIARLNSLAQLASSGVSPTDAVAIVDNQKRLETQQAIFGNPFMLIALAGAAVLIAPQVIRMMQDKGASHA